MGASLSADDHSRKNYLSRRVNIVAGWGEKIAVLHQVGVFDSGWYLNEYPDIRDSAFSPTIHYLAAGESEGRRPNFIFDPVYYLDQNPDVADAKMSPLLHYAEFGWKEGRCFSPFFDVAWYQEQYSIAAEEQCLLSHYLRNHLQGVMTPHPLFDAEFYLETNPDVKAAGLDPFEHFIRFGWREGRAPFAGFEPAFYWSQHLNGNAEINPFEHYLKEGMQANLPIHQ